MTRIDLTAIHAAWDAYRHHPHAEVIAVNARPEVGRDLALDVLIYLPEDDSDDPSMRTWFATAGLSLLPHLTDVGPFELELAVRGRLTADERAALARRFADVAIAPLRHDLVVRSGLAFGFDLPVFVDRAGVVLVDVGWSTPEHLPRTAPSEPRVRVLDVFTLHARELDQLAEVGAAEARLQLREAQVDLIARDRPAIDLAPPASAARAQPAPTEPPEPPEPLHDVASLWAEIDRWLAAHAPTTLASLAAGVASETVHTVEEALGRTLPPEVVASYQIHDGYAGLVGYEYVSLEVGLELWQAQAEAHGEAPKRAAHKDRIKPVFWHPGWFPIAMDSGGNLMCVDLDPAPAGRFGQIVYWEMREGPFVSGHAGWGAWLATFRDELAAGKYGADANGRITNLAP